MRIDEGPSLGGDNLRRLPAPTDHATRNRDAMARMLDAVAPRLFAVASVSGPWVTLADMGGTVLDEQVRWAGDRPFPGDLGYRVVAPGRGHRDAAPSYFFVVLATTRGTPTVTVGPTDGPAAGTGATATVNGTDAYCRVTLTTGSAPGTGVLFTVNWSVARPSASYGVWFSGRNAAARNLVAGGIAQSAADTAKCPVGVALTPAASTQYLFNVFMVDA